MDSSSISRELIDDAIDHCNGEMDQAINYVQIFHPDVDRKPIKKLIKHVLDGTNENAIDERDMEGAYALNDDEAAIELLLAQYPHIKEKNIRKTWKKFCKNTSTKIREPKRITEDDVLEAIELYNFAFGPDLRRNVISYLSQQFETLTEAQIASQVYSYDFEGTAGAPEGNPHELVATPPPRGSTYRPSDFSPSSMGASSLPAMEYLKEKRAKYFPDYHSPPQPTSATLRTSFSPRFSPVGSPQRATRSPLLRTLSPNYATPTHTRSTKPTRSPRSPSEAKRRRLSF
ncbi:hypothetical protein HA402_002003 [Bradysia odoriphaga]|nr:hypothetical protein HA402_002003 [Bradysia odoriphaga]